MRAGSLSDPRVVALLNERFVCARIPELCTKDLIPDARDVALLERLHETSKKLGPTGGPGFWGGEREAFLSPAGELLDVFLSLGTQGQADSQFQEDARECADAKVARFFERAAAALQRVHGVAPRGLRALQDGTAPAVAAAERAARPPRRAPDGHFGLLVSVRNDYLMYSGLVGDDLWSLPAAAARALVPDAARVGASCEWPRAQLLELARRAVPRGHVAPRLDDASLEGRVRAVVEAVAGDLVRGRLEGELQLAPTQPHEFGARAEARIAYTLRTGLHGDFTFDRRTGGFTALRLASVEAQLEHRQPRAGPSYPGEDYHLGVELLPWPDSK